MNAFQRFFIWCAGSDQSILEKCPDSERTKHAGFGSLVIVPAVLAFISMSYAVSTLTENATVYFVLGTVWALIVFTFDRFIVSTFRKRKNVARDIFSFAFSLYLPVSSSLMIFSSFFIAS